MDYRRLGRSGLKVSEICLGTMTFGHGSDAAEAERIVHTSLDAGVNFFDTADGYSNGESESMLGCALGKRRRDTVIATKVFAPTGPGPNDSGMSRVHIMNAIEDSLRRLGTDYIDFRNGPLGVKPLSDDLATVIVLPSVVDTRAATSCHQIGNRRANL